MGLQKEGKRVRNGTDLMRSQILGDSGLRGDGEVLAGAFWFGFDFPVLVSFLPFLS